MAIDLILGTAGHIDHGKTALIKALTGVDTDRLPEEKRRGMTIDLGFAALDLGAYRLGIVDVPGHERFVRNMLSGATGIDVALLVVAADDSVKPQTREHFEILRLLRLPAGVIALTKCDLAEPEWLAMVEDEIRELVADSFLADAPLVRTSARNGEGIDALREALTEAAAGAAASPRQQRVAGPFRMPIDRTFAVAGHGTVVTGSIASGSVHLGDELAIEPGGVRVRVRGLQQHSHVADEVRRGQRAAINLSGVHHDEIHRGQELATPGYLTPSRRVTVRLQLLPSAPRPLKHRQRVRVHLGTDEVMSTVLLLDRDRLQPGDRALAQLLARRPVVATWEQGLVIRAESPVVTIGGGAVLVAEAIRIRRRDTARLSRLEQLEADNPLARAGAACYLAGPRDVQPADLARLAGVVDGDRVLAALIERGDVQEIAVSPTRRLHVHRDTFDEVAAHVESTLEKMHRREPLRSLVDRAQLIERLARQWDANLLDAVLEQMQVTGRIRLAERGVALAGHGATLAPHERKLLDEICEIYRAAACQPPTVGEVRARVAKNRALVPQLVALAASEGELVSINTDYYLHRDVERQMRSTLAGQMADGEGLTVSQIREMLGTTRKYAVPLCEYLDRIGFTRRDGDRRFLAREDTVAGS